MNSMPVHLWDGRSLDLLLKLIEIRWFEIFRHDIRYVQNSKEVATIKDRSILSFFKELFIFQMMKVIQIRVDNMGRAETM